MGDATENGPKRIGNLDHPGVTIDVRAEERSENVPDQREREKSVAGTPNFDGKPRRNPVTAATACNGCRPLNRVAELRTMNVCGRHDGSLGFRSIELDEHVSEDGARRRAGEREWWRGRVVRVPADRAARGRR